MSKYKYNLKDKTEELIKWAKLNRPDVRILSLFRKVANSKGHNRIFIKYEYINHIYLGVLESRIDRFLKSQDLVVEDRNGYFKILKNRLKSHDEFLDDLKKARGDNFILLTKYTGIHNKIKVKHILCGGVFTTYPRLLLSKTSSKCYVCAGNINKTTDIFKKEVFSLVGSEYEVLGEYINNKSSIKIKHLFCNNIYETSPRGFLFNENRCPICNSSKLEIKTLKFLKDNNIHFEREKTFDDCKYINKLRFDFFIPSKNLCIELDGEQHFRPIDFFGGLKSYILSKKRDYIKNKFCRDNSINLLRIPYYEKDHINKYLFYKLIYKR